MDLGEQLYCYVDWNVKDPGVPPDRPPGMHGTPVRAVRVHRDHVQIKDAWYFESGHAAETIDTAEQTFRRDDPRLAKVIAEQFHPDVANELAYVLGSHVVDDTKLSKLTRPGKPIDIFERSPRDPDPCPNGRPAPFISGTAYTRITIDASGVEVEDTWELDEGPEPFIACGAKRFAHRDPALLALLTKKLQPKTLDEVKKRLDFPTLVPPFEYTGAPIRIFEYSPNNPDPCPEEPAVKFRPPQAYTRIEIDAKGVVVQDTWDFSEGRADVYVECAARRFKHHDAALLKLLDEKLQPRTLAEVRSALGLPFVEPPPPPPPPAPLPCEVWSDRVVIPSAKEEEKDAPEIFCEGDEGWPNDAITRVRVLFGEEVSAKVTNLISTSSRSSGPVKRARNIVEMRFAASLRPCATCGNPPGPELEASGSGVGRWVLSGACRFCGTKLSYAFSTKGDPREGIEGIAPFELGKGGPTQIISADELHAEWMKVEPLIASDPRSLVPARWMESSLAIARALTCVLELRKLGRRNEEALKRLLALERLHRVDAPRIWELSRGVLHPADEVRGVLLQAGPKPPTVIELRSYFASRLVKRVITKPNGEVLVEPRPGPVTSVRISEKDNTVSVELELVGCREELFAGLLDEKGVVATREGGMVKRVTVSFSHKVDHLNMDTLFVDREARFAFKIDRPTGRTFVAIAVSNRMADYEEYYEVDPDTFESYVADPKRAHDFVAKAKRRELDHLLLLKPGSDRGWA